MDGWDALDEFSTLYRFDALSHYLYDGLLSPTQHLAKYGGGHCLDLAVAFSLRYGGYVVGKVNPNYSFHPHYFVVRDNCIVDPSMYFVLPLEVGATATICGVENTVVAVGERSVTVAKPGKERLWYYRRIFDISMHVAIVKHTWKTPLSVRHLDYTGWVAYLPEKNLFRYKEQDYSLAALADFRYELHRQLGFDLYTRAVEFSTRYLHLPESFWRYQL